MENLKNRLCCIDSLGLKLIAVISMTIDHIGAVLLPQYLFLRVIGRLAFPIYCFMLVEGFKYTKNVWKYLLRLVGFAVVSEVFFDLAFYGSISYSGHQNVYFTLFLGLVLLITVKRIREINLVKNPVIKGTLEFIMVVIISAAALVMRTDYSFAGVLMIYVFYIMSNNKIMMAIMETYINLEMFGGVQGFAAFSLIPIFMYNGEKGKYSLKWLFYLYYPAHLILLYLTKLILG